MKKLFYILTGIFAAAAIFCIVYFGGSLDGNQKENEFKRGRFSKGVSVEGVDLEGMTMAQARETLKKQEKRMIKECAMKLNVGEHFYTIEGDDFSVDFNTEDVLKEAMLWGKGSLAERASMGRKNFDIEKKVRGIKEEKHIKEICKKENHPACDASFEFTPNENKHITVTEEEKGFKLNYKEIYNAVEKAAANGKKTLCLEGKEILPKMTADKLKEQVIRRSYAETSYAQSPYCDENRVYNIKKCVGIINAAKITLKEGESLSLNVLLGDRTEKAGWRLAPGYVLGRSEDQPGGGVCQISSTLYCAALKADLTIVERKNHSIPVGYVKQGLDATISTGGPDLVIRNDTGNTVYIGFGLTGKMGVYCEIYGAPFKGFNKITLSAEKTQDIEPSGEMIYTYSSELSPGEEQVYIKRRVGSKFAAYKNYYNGDELIKTVKAPSSVYPSYNGETRVGR